MILILDVKDNNSNCRSCGSKTNLIAIKALNEKVNIYDSIILCEDCKKKLVNRLLIV